VVGGSVAGQSGGGGTHRVRRKKIDATDRDL
jgi:hypothetical protein